MEPSEALAVAPSGVQNLPALAPVVEPVTTTQRLRVSPGLVTHRTSVPSTVLPAAFVTEQYPPARTVPRTVVAADALGRSPLAAADTLPVAPDTLALLLPPQPVSVIAAARIVMPIA
jgi:hypothetical protein